MKIVLNNKEEILPKDNITINELLVIKNFTWKMLVIKVNGKVLKRSEYESTILKENDDVSVFHLITGG